jgi:hypothetical protein
MNPTNVYTTKKKGKNGEEGKLASIVSSLMFADIKRQNKYKYTHKNFYA